MTLVAPGDSVPTRCCSTILNREEWPPYGTDERTARDLLLLLPVDTAEQIADLHIDVAGENGLNVRVEPAALAYAATHLETRTYGSDLGPAAPDGHRIAAGWVARVPVTLEPTRPWDIGGVRYPLRVAASYRVGGDSRPRTFSARGAVDAQVSRAIYEMGVAALVLPLVCIVSAFRRWRRTR